MVGMAAYKGGKMERKRIIGKFPIKALLIVGVALALINFTLLGACDKEDGETLSSTSPTTVTTSPTTEAEEQCPVSCSADSDGWSVVFECEEEGQMVSMKNLENRQTEWRDGKLVKMHAYIEYTFETSGNVYQAIIDIVACEESITGLCITVEASGETLGNEPVVCTNF